MCCSRKCGAVLLWQHRDPTAGQWKREDRECDKCGATYYPSRIEQRYCSFQCSVTPRATFADRPCARCGETFTPSVAKQTCCSLACGTRFKQKRVRPVRACPQCGQPFRKDQTFCSRHCAGEARRNEAGREVAERDCEQCGTTFKPASSNVRFCGHACAMCSRRKKDRACEQCGETFIPHTPNQRCCSHRCGSEIQKTRVDRTCAHCGTTFTVWPSTATRLFCSLLCARRSRVRQHCKRGHEFTRENTRVTRSGERVCKTCMAEHQLRYRQRRAEAA